MGKRKNKDKKYIKKKIRRLKRKLERIPVEVESEDSSPVTSPPPSQPPISPISRTALTPLSPVTHPPKSLSPRMVLNQPAHTDLDQDLNTEDDLPEELLQALGTEGEETIEVGEAIRPELAHRWMRIIQTGLGKEPRDAIIKTYPPPINFPRALAPIMNAEISASLSEPSLKRDKRICNRQNLTGKLMTCLGKSLSKVLTGNINSKILVEEINDAAKFAAEIYNQDSSSRKFLALAGASKTIQDAVQTATTDNFLFGADCADKIRAAQAIQKASLQIKPVEKKSNKPVASLKKLVDWRGPPQYQQQQRARGGQHNLQYQHHRQPLADQAHWKTQTPSSRSRSRYRR